VTDVLARKDRALTPEETEALLSERLGDQVVGSTVEFGTFTLHVAPAGWHAAAQLCRDESLLAYDMFDCLLGVDAREEGFDVVAVLYSTSTGNRICLRTRCDGGREAPVCPSIADVYRGADWMERETWDMFGIEFEGHPGLEPRLLTVENFEGWPLRKDFHLTSRVAKPWPGVKEPAELDDEGNVIEREPEIGGAPGPYDLDKAMAEQARAVNAPAIEAASEDDTDAGTATTEAGGPAPSSEDDGAEPPAAEIDQETFDRLIAEGKSERIARSKAKAAFIKKQRAAAAADAGAGDGGDDPEAAEAVTPQPDVERDEEADRVADAEVESIEEAPGVSPEDERPTAAEKAEARRKEQAEARRRKAEERAAEAEGTDDAADDEEGRA
jgi:NADH:ubiquinone oxidoreductase subunit C